MRVGTRDFVMKPRKKRSVGWLVAISRGLDKKIYTQLYEAMKEDYKNWDIGQPASQAGSSHGGNEQPS